MTTRGKIFFGRRIIQGALVAATALTLLVGFHPGGAAAKSESLTCTTLENRFTDASDASLAAMRRGDTASAAYYENMSFNLQLAYLSMGCNTGTL